jgi:hypothetical protein
MAKVVIIGRSKASRPAKGAVGVKRVRDSRGQLKTLRTLDAGSATFGQDLQYVFSKNVAKARRDNKRITGAADVAVAKR